MVWKKKSTDVANIIYKQAIVSIVRKKHSWHPQNKKKAFVSCEVEGYQKVQALVGLQMLDSK